MKPHPKMYEQTKHIDEFGHGIINKTQKEHLLFSQLDQFYLSVHDMK